MRSLHLRTPQVVGEKAHEAVVEERFADWSYNSLIFLEARNDYFVRVDLRSTSCTC